MSNQNPIGPAEAQEIAIAKARNDQYDEAFAKSRKDWGKQIDPLFQTIKLNFSLGNAPKIIEVQSSALVYRQMIADEISEWMSERTSVIPLLDKAKHDKMLFYSMGFALKTNTGEKAILIEAHVVEITRQIKLIETYIEFLRATAKNLESIGFVIKSIIELHSYLGK